MINDTGVFSPKPVPPVTPRELIVEYISLFGFASKYQPRVLVDPSARDVYVPESNCSGDPISPAALSDTRLSIFNLLPP